MTIFPKILLEIARRVVWFKPPDETLNDKVYFLCYLMQYGLTEDIVTVQKQFSKKEFRHAINHAYPGILDQRSWAYWNLVLNGTPDKPMPKRSFRKRFP